MNSGAAQSLWVDPIEAKDEMGWSETKPWSDAGIEGELVRDDGGG